MACGGTFREGMASSGSGPRGPENRRKKRLGTGHRRKETLFPMDEVASMARARDRREWGKDRLSLLCREGEKYFQKKLFCRIRFLPHNKRDAFWEKEIVWPCYVYFIVAEQDAMPLKHIRKGSESGQAFCGIRAIIKDTSVVAGKL